MAAQTRLARISFTHAGSSEDKLMRYMAPMTPPSFRALIAEVERKAELQPGQSITLKYTDNRNKPINIRDDEDVAGAWEDAGTNPIDLFCVVNSGTTASIQASFDRLLEKRGKAPSGASSLLQSVASSKAPSPQGVGRPTNAVAPPSVVAPPAAFAGPPTAPTRPVVPPPQTSPSAPASVTPSREPSAAAAGGPSSSTSPSARAPPTATVPPYATAASPSTPPYGQQQAAPTQPAQPVAPSPPVAFVPPTPAPAATGGRPPFVAAMAATASVAPSGPAAPGGRPPFVSAKAATTSLPASATGGHSAAPPPRTGSDVARLREGAPAASEAVVAMVLKQAGNNVALAANHLSVFEPFTTDDMKKPPTTKFEETEVRKLQRVYPTFTYEKLRDVWRTNNGDAAAITIALDNQGVRGR